MQLRRDLQSWIEGDAAVGFLAPRKVALTWFNDMEGATTGRVKAHVNEARAETTDTERELTKHKLLTQGLAQHKEREREREREIERERERESQRAS